METNPYCDAKQVSFVFRFSKENDGFGQFQEPCCCTTLSSFLEREIFEKGAQSHRKETPSCKILATFLFLILRDFLMSQFYDDVEIISLLFNFQGNYDCISIIIFHCLSYSVFFGLYYQKCYISCNPLIFPLKRLDC